MQLSVTSCGSTYVKDSYVEYKFQLNKITYTSQINQILFGKKTKKKNNSEFENNTYFPLLDPQKIIPITKKSFKIFDKSKMFF